MLQYSGTIIPYYGMYMYHIVLCILCMHNYSNNLSVYSYLCFKRKNICYAFSQKWLLVQRFVIILCCTRNVSVHYYYDMFPHCIDQSALNILCGTPSQNAKVLLFWTLIYVLVFIRCSSDVNSETRVNKILNFIHA